MSRIVRASAVIFGLIACAAAQPVVSSVLNAASYATFNVPPGGNTNVAFIAQGSIFVVFGTGLGPASLVQAAGLPLAAKLPADNGTSITVTSGGKTVEAFIVYTLATQVAAILPSSTPAGPATVNVTYNGQTSSTPGQVVVAKSAPGVFTFNAQGTGQAAAQIPVSATSAPINSLTNPARPGSTMVLYATGLGPISGADNMAPGAVQIGGVTVTVGGKVIQPLYAGRSPNYPGLDQINFTLPQDVPTGCYTPGVVTVDQIPSNAFVLATAGASGACVHPFGLNQDALSKVDAGGTVNVGVFAALRGVALGIPAEGGGGLFENAGASGLFTTFDKILSAFGIVQYPVANNACVVYDNMSGAPGLPIPDFSTLGISRELKAADALRLNGPGGKQQGITRPGSVGYLWVSLLSGFDTPVLGPGTWTLSGDSGPDVAAFSATTEFPVNLVWTNVGNLSTPPRSDVTMTWTGGGTSAQPNVNITGNATVVNSKDGSHNRGKSFVCMAPASAGRFVIPADITKQLPVPSADGDVALGSLGITTGGGSPFNASLTNGQPLDGGFFGFGEGHTIPVTWK